MVPDCTQGWGRVGVCTGPLRASTTSMDKARRARGASLGRVHFVSCVCVPVSNKVSR